MGVVEYWSDGVRKKASSDINKHCLNFGQMDVNKFFSACYALLHDSATPLRQYLGPGML
jgi:hypothetical protein